ncbi:MAG TPA: hypothetical protein VFO10_13720 [Oligoflexus sp.]|uniref:hypothetical protein n=1 Tax=Oligoflexus sp. TaxID=1971216 RepID=UPI002D7F629A|nr:hypothetical protein [Oligoflexus sp.]HET9238314.1 hypothetical protein [Oligoflexus sp.]
MQASFTLLFIMILAASCKPAAFKSVEDVADSEPTVSEDATGEISGSPAPVIDEPIEAVEVITAETKLQVPAPPPVVDDVKVACADAAKNGTLKSKAVPLFFPAKTATCEFEKNDNLSRKNEVIRARREETVELPLQGMTRLCNMKFDAPQQPMRFDDEIMITLNNLVVASSQDYSTKSRDRKNNQLVYPNGLSVDNDGLMSYKWLPPNGMQNLNYLNGDLNKYCLGLDPKQADFAQLCQIPKTSTNGTMSLKLPQDAFLKLAAKAGLVFDKQIQAVPKATLMFMTTGDNDDSDCQHLDFRMNVTIDYI